MDEVLTRPDETSLTTPALSDAETEKMLALLDQAGVHDVRVKQGRQRLESLFLEIVENAQREGVATAGAGNAGQVAAFLTGDNADPDAPDAQARDAAKVLDDLIAPTPAATPKPAKPTTPAPPPADDVVAGLTAPAPATPIPPKPATPAAGSIPTPPKPKADQDVLDDLMG